MQRVSISLELVDALEIASRTAELARVFGIDFFSVLTRGTQYRVESMLLRLARTQRMVLPSPSKHLVATQPALESLPLILEPKSQLYTDPVAVLDFRSLYPSVVIAHNYCYSTCLGPAKSLRRILEGGRTSSRHPAETPRRHRPDTPPEHQPEVSQNG